MFVFNTGVRYWSRSRRLEQSTRIAHPLLAQVISLIWRLHRWVYRRSGGRVGGRLLGVPMLLLTTTGRRSGQPQTTALTYLTEGTHYAVVASNGGAPQHPAWLHNLRAFPQAQIQVGSMVHRVHVREAVGAERERLWNRMVQLYAGYRGYQARTTRQIPVLVLEPINQPSSRPATGPPPLGGPRRGGRRDADHQSEGSA
ncbi:MAG TPA: nitroreductase family deazaflavin-dependent oxidoreductase [bacterium]|nr:nitroreductase family deazaflavin-dependent oxidoreductase [bacterium]